MDEPKYSFKPTGQLAIRDMKPNYNISFHNNGKEVGKLDFNGSALVFTGEAEESAKVFVDWIARSFASRLEEERKAAREACAKFIESHGATLANGAILVAAIRARGEHMTPEQQAYYDNELREIRSGGYGHEAYVVKAIHGLGGYIGPVDPPVVGFGQDADPFYQQYLRNWDEVEKLISQLREEATKAWGNT